MTDIKDELKKLYRDWIAESLVDSPDYSVKAFLRYSFGDEYLETIRD